MLQANRRGILGMMAAGGAAVVGGSSLLAAGRKPVFFGGARKIGLQMYTLGDAVRKDMDGTFAAVAKIGYTDIEMPELYGKKPAELRTAADRFGLKISSFHVPASAGSGFPGALSLSDDPAKLVDAMGAMGAAYAVVPIVPFPAGFRPKSMATFGDDLRKVMTRDQWKACADLLNEKADKLKPQGVSVGYHNHNVEFAPLDEAKEGETGWDVLVRGTSPKLVHFEVDLGWVAAAGLDVVAFLAKMKGRVQQVHVKDLKASTVANFGIKMDATEVGSGKMDWAKVLPAVKAAGVLHYYVEQEPPFTMPRMDAAAKSYGYLAGLRV